MIVADMLSLQVSYKGDSICIFDGDTALIESEIRTAISQLEQSSEAQHEKELYQLLLRAFHVKNRDELISFLEDCVRLNPALAAVVSYEPENSKEVSPLITILNAANKQYGASVTQQVKLQGAENIARLLREISETEFKARQFTIRYHVTPWYKLSFSDYLQRFQIWFNDIQYRLAQWFSKKAQGSIWRDTFKEYTRQYKGLKQDARDTLRCLFQETSAECPPEQNKAHINPSILHQIQMKWLYKEELREAVAKKTYLSTMPNHLSLLFKEAGKWDLFVGDKACFYFQTLFSVSKHQIIYDYLTTYRLERVMTKAREIGLLSGRSEDEKQALLEQIIFKNPDSSLPSISRFLDFPYEDIFCCEGAERQQSQTIFLTLLSSNANKIQEVTRLRNDDWLHTQFESDYKSISSKPIISRNYRGFQANLLALLRSAPDTERYVYNGLQYLSYSLGEYEDHPALKAACRDAIVRAGKNALCVAQALVRNSSLCGYQHRGNSDLGTDAQKNIDTIVAAGRRAEPVAELLRLALKAGLLAQKGDEVREAVLQHADKIDDQIVNHFKRIQSLSFCAEQERLLVLLKTLLAVNHVDHFMLGLRRLDYRKSMFELDDFRTIFATHDAAYCCIAMALACRLYVEVNGVDWRRNVAWDRVKKKIIERFNEQYLNHTGDLFYLISQYPSILDPMLLEQTLTKDDARCGEIYRALSKLETCGTHFLTRDNYVLLLEENNDPVLLAKVLGGDLEDLPSFEALSQLSVLSGLVVPEKIETDLCFKLYKELVAIPGLFSINVLRGLLQLSIADQHWLLDVMKNNSEGDQLQLEWLFHKPQSAVAYIMAQKYALHQRYQIASMDPMAIPGPNEWESSMRDDYVKLAKERLDALPRFKPANDTQLEETEVKIREMLLQAIVDEHPLMNQPEQNELPNQRVRFIKDNKLALARRADAKLISQAVSMFNQCDSTAQTAWRAYEPLAKTVGWPNLLTQSTNNAPIFSTRAAITGMMQDTVTEQSASMAIRLAAATMFNAANDPELPEETRQLLRSKFVHQIAEIRRAHNYDATLGEDSPSCFPGCWSRLGLILDAHPQFVREETSSLEAILALVEGQLRGFVQATVKDFEAQTMTDVERRLLLSAIRLYNHPFAEQALKDPAALEYNLSVTDDDLMHYMSQEEPGFAMDDAKKMQCFVDKVNCRHTEFIHELCQRIQTSLESSITDALARANLFIINKNIINYLVLKYLSHVGALVSIPSSLVVASMDPVAADAEVNTNSKRETAQPEQEIFAVARQLAEAKGRTIDDGLMIEVGDRLRVLMSRLSTKACTYGDVRGIVHQKLADLKDSVLEQSVIEAIASYFFNQQTPSTVSVSALGLFQSVNAATSSELDAAHPDQEPPAPSAAP